MSKYEHTQTEARIKRAMAQMPFGGLTKVSDAASRVGNADRYTPAPVTLEAVADYLEILGEVLRAHTTQVHKDESRLRKLEDEHAVFVGIVREALDEKARDDADCQKAVP